jgi:predicted nucleic acid-binding protein
MVLKSWLRNSLVRIEKVVANASPLIILFKGGLGGLLPELFTEIAVPNGACEEIIAGGPSDPAATALAETSWIHRLEINEVAPEVLIWNLGVGESEVLSFALADKSCVAMVVDRAARNCARTLGIQTVGTGGALVLAKRRGLIPSVSIALQQLIDAGLWISDEIATLLRTQAGEKNSSL